MCERGANMTLKELRKNCNLTQKEASEIVGVPLRTYVMYENGDKGVNELKYERMVSNSGTIFVESSSKFNLA